MKVWRLESGPIFLLSTLLSLISILPSCYKITPMRRYLALIPLVLLFACRTVSTLPFAVVPGTPTPSLTASIPPTLTLTPPPSLAAATPTLTLPPLPEAPFKVVYHPDGGLYAGDRVSFEVIAPEGAIMEGRQAVIEVEGVEGAKFDPAEFARFGIAGRVQATLFWAWNTSGLPPGNYNLTFTIQPDGVQWTDPVALLPRSALPSGEVGAHWVSAQSECCTVYTITGTEAERDLQMLLDLADQQAAIVEKAFKAPFPERATLVMLPRVLGHGGFANQEISLSYLDRRYSGADFAIVLRHELVHFLDRYLGGELRPTILVEGLAVYLSGGHFKEEPLLLRAAALLELGWYQPMAPLADDFYPSQHEIGYMEAGALVQYMVERWGWEAFSRFYRDIRPGPPGSGQVEAMDEALARHFELTFKEVETGFLETLRQQEVSAETQEDVRMTVAFYDTVRRYQQALDPSAFYMTAWLPDGKQLREHGIVADLLRHPSAPENISLESLLVSADTHLRAGDYAAVEQLLEAVNKALDAMGS